MRGSVSSRSDDNIGPGEKFAGELSTIGELLSEHFPLSALEWEYIYLLFDKDSGQSVFPER